MDWFLQLHHDRNIPWRSTRHGASVREQMERIIRVMVMVKRVHESCHFVFIRGGWTIIPVWLGERSRKQFYFSVGRYDAAKAVLGYISFNLHPKASSITLVDPIGNAMDERFLGRISFIFVQFSVKIMSNSKSLFQTKGWHPPPPRVGNPRSVIDYYTNVRDERIYYFLRKMSMAQTWYSKLKKKN